VFVQSKETRDVLNKLASEGLSNIEHALLLQAIQKTERTYVLEPLVSR
jgi:hypothetical protein